MYSFLPVYHHLSAHTFITVSHTVMRTTDVGISISKMSYNVSSGTL